MNRVRLIPLNWARNRIKCPLEIALDAPKRSAWDLSCIDSVYDGTVNFSLQNIIQIAVSPTTSSIWDPKRPVNEIFASVMKIETIRLIAWGVTISVPLGEGRFDRLSWEAREDIIRNFRDADEIWIHAPFCTSQDMLIPSVFRWSLRDILRYIWIRHLKKKTVDWRKFPHEKREQWNFRVNIGRRKK